MKIIIPGVQPDTVPDPATTGQSGPSPVNLPYRLVVTFCLLLGIAGWIPIASSQDATEWPDQAQCRALQTNNDASAADDLVTRGWCVAIDDRRGNCIACHTFNITPWPESLPVAGNLAPPMVAMRARFPDSATLRSVIEDATIMNKRSAMPPYLKHHILDEEEIDQLLAFLGTL